MSYSYAQGWTDELRQACHDIRQPIAGVLANATRAAGPSGRVTVEVSVRATQMLLAVEDDGPGFRLLPEGCGLGLSGVAREATEYNGRLECGRSNLDVRRVNPWLPPATSGMGGRAADANCLV